ncbi:MAG: 3-deoxy-manno-octulosonate cytidylyltransferase [Deltaproteobacteria bacterium]|nr:MAG: 3-deoxy-manno-octulosonate cytidylyltransferase [Deltaproteobacteria bacterium]
MPKVVGIIPARYGSQRLPGKMLATILDRPMILHVYQRAARAASLEQVVVATDDSRIQEAVVTSGGEALMTSPDHASGTDRVAEAARHLRLPDDAIVVNIQGDEPLLEAEMLDSLATGLVGIEEVPMATLARPGTDNADYRDPAVVKVVLDSRSRALYFSRTPIPAARDGSSTPPYYKHLGFYAYRNSFLQQFAELPAGRLEDLEKLEQLRALEHGFPILVVVTHLDTISVDTAEDLARVRRVMVKKYPQE